MNPDKPDWAMLAIVTLLALAVAGLYAIAELLASGAFNPRIVLVNREIEHDAGGMD